VVQCALYKREITPEYEVSVIRNLVIAVLAARLQVQFVDAPVLKVVTEGHDAHVLDQVQSTCPVEVEYRCERPACPTHGIQHTTFRSISTSWYLKTETSYSWWYLCQILTDFQNSFTTWFHRKFAAKWLLKIPAHLAHVSTLPCETLMSENKRLTINHKVVQQHFKLWWGCQ